MVSGVADLYPLQQGLRQGPENTISFSQSIGRRPISTTTRIETALLRESQTGTVNVADLYPLQQGLRLFIKIVANRIENGVADLYPLQQGLRPFLSTIQAL